MTVSRRTVLKGISAAAMAPALGVGRETSAAPADAPPIVDTHQHLWDLKKFRLPWLESSEGVLRQTYWTPEYAEATRGLGVVQSVYMEVDVAPEQHVLEAKTILDLSRGAQTPTRAAVIGGRPGSEGFAAYLDQVGRDPRLKGVRQVLHSGETPEGYCLSPAFVKGVKELGRRGLRFDLCMRPAELGDGLKLVEQCPDTRFIVDHCGNADVNAFGPMAGKPSHDPEAWKRSMDRLAARPNVICKISGIVARARPGWKSDDLAPVVNHCLDTFGPDRVVFGGDWPVCLLGSPYRGWVEALRAIVSNRPAADQRKLWHDNAVRFYELASA